MKILHASSELHPYSKSGGLADMAGALAKSLAALGHQVGVVTPLHRGIREKFPALKKFDWHIDLPLGPRRVTAGVWTLQPSAGHTIYFIDQPEFFDRPGLYGAQGADYPDNAERFIFSPSASPNWRVICRGVRNWFICTTGRRRWSRCW